MKKTKFETFKYAFIDCLLWSECDYTEDGEFGENFEGCEDELSEETLEEIEKDCRGFFDENYEEIKDNLEQAGHDFCLTRNEHGAGFWDSGNMYYEDPDTLTENAKSYGNLGLYRGDDEKIYHHN